NIQGAFAVADTATIRGASVVLIDDVTTTGATFLEARETLLAAGAKEVTALAVAH
ncbi:ComF family protein, partial [Candidatus Parcubacteria bacterium]|nr:ComF family protein [Candidatus Parcubacteria bacterium]